MIKDIKQLDKRLDKIEKDILKLKSDVALEQVKNNEELEKILEELNSYREEVFSILVEKYNKIVPKSENSSTRELFSQSERYRSIMKMLGKDSLFVERFGFDRTIYEIGSGENVDRINQVLKEFIIDMNTIGIGLTSANFNYSIYSSKYMNVLFENLNNKNYLFVMKRCFDSIYWECPLLLTHLELCVRSLVFNNKKIIVNHINKLLQNNLKSVNSTKDGIIEKYVKTKQKFNELRMKDFYNIFEYFINNKGEIEKYIPGSSSFNKIINNYISEDKYYNMNDEDKKFFFSNIKSLYYDLIEYKMISKFKVVYYYLAKILDGNDDALSKYKEAVANVKKLEKNKNKLDKKINLLLSKRERINETNIEKINKVNDQIKEISALLSKCIGDIKTETDLITDMRFISDFKKDINSTSTIYEVTYFVSKYYRELYKIFNNDKTIDETMVNDYVDEFRHIQYNENLTIMNSISFLEIDNIKDLITKKYSMYNINVLIPDDYHELDKVLDELMVLIRYENITLLSYSPENINVLLKIHEEIEGKNKALEG